MIRTFDSIFINGEWVSTAWASKLISPNTEEIIATAPVGDIYSAKCAANAARNAFDSGPWPRMSVAERAAYLTALAEELAKCKDELAAAFTEVAGGLVGMGPIIAGIGTRIIGKTTALIPQFETESRIKTDKANVGILRREPAGVVLISAPWNAPFTILMSKLAPALLAGNTIIACPSPRTPIEALIVAECAKKIGLPPGVLNILPVGDGALEELVSSPLVDMLTFTGETTKGSRLAALMAQRGRPRFNLKLSGRSAAVVLEDYSIPQAANILTKSICMLAGQVSATPARAIVPAHLYNQYAEAIISKMEKMRAHIGPSTSPESRMGPLISDKQVAEAHAVVARGKSCGAKVAYGGKRINTRGFFFEPTLLTGVRNDMSVARQPSLVPVLCLIPHNGLEDAVNIANDSEHGLGGIVITNDNKAAYDVMSKVRAGGLSQTSFKADDALPFGGFNRSGVGREGGIEGLLTFTETKTILMDGEPT